MPTSGEIAQMFASQQAAFASQNVFASQIGISAPGMGLGAYGRGPGQFQPMPGGAPPVWSYAPTGMLGPGYGGGNQFAGGMMSGIGGAASLGGIGLGLAAGFGKLGPLGHLFDPFGAAMGGFKAAGGFAGGAGAFGAGALAAMPAIGLGMAASHVVGSFVHGGQQQAGIAREMGQFNFFNPMSRTGSGFTRDDAQMVGSRIRELAHIPEMMTSVEELTRLLPNLRKAGTFQGVKEITEFQSRFNDSIKTIKVMSKMLGTTMEQASEFFAHSSSVGFLGKQAQLQNVLNAQFTSGVTGMSLGQVMGAQQQGAQMGVQLGVGRRLGAQAITANIQRLGFAQQTGAIGEGDLEDITGLQGPEAVAAAGTRLTQAAIGMTQNSAAGRLAMMGLAKFDSSGKAIGIDADLVQQFREGRLSVDDLKRRVSSLTDTQKISATARAGSLGALTAAHAGPEVLGQILQQVMTDRFGGNSAKADEALNLLMQRNGLTEREADVFKKTMGQSATGMEDLARIKQREALIAEKYSPGAYWQKFKTALRNVTTAPFEEAGASVYNAIGKEYDKFFDDVVGRHMVTLSKEGADSFAKALAGNSAELRRELGRLHGVNLDVKGIARDTRYSWSGAAATGINVATLGLASVINPDLRKQLSMLGGPSDEEIAADEQARARSLRQRAVGGTMAGAQAANRLSGFGFLGGAVEEWQLGQKTEDRTNAAKMFTGLSETFHGKIVDDLARFADPDKRMLVEGAVSRGDVKQLSALTGMTEEQMMRKGGTAVKAALLARRKLGDAAEGASLGSIVAGAAAGGAGFSIGNVRKDMAYDLGVVAQGSIYTEKEIQAAQEHTRGELRKVFGDDSALAASPNARRAAGLLANSGDKRFVDDINNASISTIQSMMLKKFNVNLNEEEAKGVKDAASRIKELGADSVKHLVGAAELADSLGNDQVVRKRTRDAAQRFQEGLNSSGFAEGSAEMKAAGGIAAALSDMGNFTDSNDLMGSKSEAMRSALGEAIKTARGLKGDARKKFIAGLGSFGGIVSKGADSESALSGKKGVSVDKLASALGLGEADRGKLEETLKDVGLAGVKGLDFSTEEGKAKLHQIESKVSGMRAAGVIATGGSTTTSKDAEIMTTLKAMQETSKLQTTMLIVANKDKFGKGSYEEALKSNGAKMDSDGKVVFTKPEEK